MFSLRGVVHGVTNRVPIILICNINRMPLLELIPWDRCYLILWILRMVYCLRMVESHYNCTELTLLCRVCVFTVGHCSIPPYSEAVLHCTMQTVGGRPMSSSWLLEGLTLFALWWEELLRILLSVVFGSGVPTSARRRLWSNLFQKLAWWHRYRPDSLSRNHNVALHSVMIRFPHIYRNCWTTRLGTWTVHSSVSWRVCCFITQIYSRCPVRHIPALPFLMHWTI